jgi:hypothetical protein
MVCVDGCTSVKHDHIFMGKALKINKMQKKNRERERRNYVEKQKIAIHDLIAVLEFLLLYLFHNAVCGGIMVRKQCF